MRKWVDVFEEQFGFWMGEVDWLEGVYHMHGWRAGWRFFLIERYYDCIKEGRGRG